MPKHRKLVSCSYVNGMKCWNNFEKDEFQPKSNDDMMQCVTCKKSYLFAPKLKTLEKKETIDVIVEQEKIVVEMKGTSSSFLYKIGIHQCIWIPFD